MARFTVPRDIYHGKGSLEELKNLKGKKAMICVGGGSMKRFGFLQRAEDYLKEAGFEVKLYEGIESDPSVDTVMKGAQAMLDFGPDWIVAIGGGSPIDAAKAMWIKYEYPDITFEDMCKVFALPELRHKAHFCAVSSTSGTATEVTAFSIITDYKKGTKYPIADFQITPDVAIVDPDLAETMPKKLVAHTGMDAMTHAIEAYVSTAHCEYTDSLQFTQSSLSRRPLSIPTMAIWLQETLCMMHSALPVWHSPLLPLVSYTPWHTRPVLYSQTTAHTLSTAQQTLCTFRRLSLTTLRTRQQRQDMQSSLTTCTSQAPPLMRR